ncbi:hypothetical protein FS837_000619 [Tulasnella sp. UAMH 9824]|nr:hypothetical protein FS837_000619 [Tulasnella sp. UAMH 9824]
MLAVLLDSNLYLNLRDRRFHLQLAQELENNVFEIHQDMFFHRFLDMVAVPSAQACLDALMDPACDAFKDALNSQIQDELLTLSQKLNLHGEHPNAIRDAILDRLPTYERPTGCFRHLQDVEDKLALCQNISILLNFISHFYRNHLAHGTTDDVDNIDKEWLEAIQTWPPLQDQRSKTSSVASASSLRRDRAFTYLRRQFVVTPEGPPRFTRKENTESTRPDLAFVLLSPGENRLPNSLSWRDVKVPIEVKLSSPEAPVDQTARYAHSIRAEQFDRNFLFTLTITRTEFRIARWDPAACYVTPSINFHKDPLSFIQLVGRLASMSPTELGYDPAFSNAGRVLHQQVAQSNRGIRTTLLITPCEVEENLRESTRSPVGEPVQYLLDDDLLCDAPEYLFGRSTRVWRAQAITDSGLSLEYNAIKQNWQSEHRINEAWFYQQTRDIEHGIAHMICFEDVHHTRDIPSPIEAKHVRGTPSQVPNSDTVQGMGISREDSTGLGDVYQRVLVRLVLKEVGRPLSELETPRQIVHVVRDIAIALEALYDRNILHRDISEGNILLSADENPVPGNRAFLADFGLAIKIDPITKLPLHNSVEHNRIVGTLPFMATIFYFSADDVMPLSVIHHGVESLFWVAMYAVFRCARGEGSKSTPKAEQNVITRCGKWLELLRSSDTMALYTTKKSILSFEADITLPGRWFSIRNFLSKVASLCKTRFDTDLVILPSGTSPPQTHDIGAIINEADAADGDSNASLDQPAPCGQALQLPISGALLAPQPRGSSEGTASTSTRSKRSRNHDDAGYYGRRSEVPDTRERSKRNRTDARTRPSSSLGSRPTSTVGRPTSVATGTTIASSGLNVSTKRTNTIYDRNLNKTRMAEVSLSAWAFMFSEVVQYTQKRVSGIGDLERRYEWYDERARS